MGIEALQNTVDTSATRMGAMLGLKGGPSTAARPQVNEVTRALNPLDGMTMSAELLEEAEAEEAQVLEMLLALTATSGQSGADFLGASAPFSGSSPLRHHGGGGGAASRAAQAPQGSTETAGTNEAADVAPIALDSKDDQKTADFINKYLEKQGSPAAKDHAGEMMVKYGKQYNVDPMLLLAVAGHETQFGKTGIGKRGMLGVGAYDANPRNAVNNRTFSGVENQIRLGAQTFAKLRAKGGAGAGSSVSQQTAAVNRGGWATDRNWHNGVDGMYAKIRREAGR